VEWYLFGGRNVLIVTTFRTGLLLFSFAFHIYYKDLVSTAAFTLYLIQLRHPIGSGDVALSSSRIVLFGCVVMAPLSQP
jgi:hypothetical protein